MLQRILDWCIAAGQFKNDSANLCSVTIVQHTIAYASSRPNMAPDAPTVG
jgi:hypothetical protein